MVADGGEATPHLYRGRVAPGLLGRLLDGVHHPGGGVVGEERVQHHCVEAAPTQGQGVGAEGGERHGDVLAAGPHEGEHRVVADRALVVEDGLALPQPAHDSHKVLHLRGSDGRQAERLGQSVDAPAQAQAEAPAGELVHGHGVGRGHHGMAGVVVGGRSGDAHALSGHTDRTRQRGGLFDVEPLADEYIADAQLLSLANLVDQLPRRLRRPRQGVETKLVHLGHLGLSSWYRGRVAG